MFQAAERESFTMGSLDADGFALQSVSVDGKVEGLFFGYTIRQEYVNTCNRNSEIIYTFPVAWNTALLGMSAVIGEKMLQGVVAAKNEAEQRYEKAVSEGDSAIMVQKSVDGMYTANLGNIKPGENVTVELRCAHLLRFEQGRVRLSIPTVVGLRYGDPYAEGGLARHESVAPDGAASYGFTLRLAISGSIARSRISSPSHDVMMSPVSDGVVIKLAGAVLDRDFVLLLEDVQGDSLAQFVRHEEDRMVVASFAPKMPETATSPLALKILVDCSGSMDGVRIRQAVKGLREVVGLLAERDCVSYSRFGSNVHRETEGMLPADKKTARRLSELFAETEANLGGTEMGEALMDTFAIPVPEGFPPVVLLITDGDVWNTREIVKQAKQSGHRIFAIGVGMAPGECLLREMAEQTGGACELDGRGEDMHAAIVRMFHRMRSRIAHDIRIDWGAAPLWQSAAPRFIYDGETVHCFATVAAQPSAAPVLRWKINEAEYSASAEKLENSDTADLFRFGMMRRIEESASEEERKILSVKYQIVSDQASLILVHERQDGEKMRDIPSVRHVPQMPAHGHGCNAMIMENMAADCCRSMLSKSAPLLSFRRASSKALCRSLPPTQKFISKAVIAAFMKAWSANLYNAASVTECLASLHGDADCLFVEELLDTLADEFGLESEQLWAVFILWAMERTGVTADRHSRRLLNKALAGVEQNNLDEVKARLETKAARGRR